jgi:hypothetical protein
LKQNGLVEQSWVDYFRGIIHENLQPLADDHVPVELPQGNEGKGIVEELADRKSQRYDFSGKIPVRADFVEGPQEFLGASIRAGIP